MSERLVFAVLAATLTATVFMSGIGLYVGIPADAPSTDEGTVETVHLYFDHDRFDHDIDVGVVEAHRDNDLVRQVYSAISSPRFAVSDSVIDSLMDVLDERMEGMSEVDKAKALLDFVYMNTWYRTDEAQFGCNEYVQYPSETLLYGKGDCEDLSLLLYVLYERAGLDAVLVNCQGHVAVAVDVDVHGESVSFRGRDYIIADPTDSLGIGKTALNEIWFVNKADNPMAANIIIVALVSVQLVIGYLFLSQWRGGRE